MKEDIKHILAEGLWKNNTGLVQLLGLCPLLAVTSTVVNGLGMGIATTLVIVLSNLCVSLIRQWLRPEIRIPVFVLVIAASVTATELLMQAYLYELYLILGIFIPLIVTNCVIIARAESFASRNPPFLAVMDGLAMGTGFTLVLVCLGAMREIIGLGTFLSQANLLFGEGAEWMTLVLFDDYSGLLMAILPPGAFIGLGLIIAMKNVIDKKRSEKVSTYVEAPAVSVQ